MQAGAEVEIAGDLFAAAERVMASYYAGRRAQSAEAAVMRALVRYARDRDAALAACTSRCAMLMAQLERAREALQDGLGEACRATAAPPEPRHPPKR